MAKLKQMERYYMIVVALIFIIVVTFFYLPSLNSKIKSKDPLKELNFDENGISILQLIKNSFNTDIYSKWPQFISLTQNTLLWIGINDTQNDYLKKLKCLNKPSADFELLKISNLNQILSQWSSNKDTECAELYKNFNQIYDIQIKNSVVRVPNSFESKVKAWLGNNEKLYEQVNNQTLIYIYNRFTYEENMFNLLRGKRPQKVSQIKPND